MGGGDDVIFPFGFTVAHGDFCLGVAVFGRLQLLVVEGAVALL